MPPVQDQGEVGACTAHAAVAILGYNMLSRRQPLTLRSRLFAYYNARALEGTAGIDSGATLRDMTNGLAKNGICDEELWPYNPDQLTLRPTRSSYSAASSNQIRIYARLNDLNDMLACLAAGHPFMFGFTVYTGFESDEVTKTGVLNLPAAGEGQVGGHAVCAVGYDQESQRFIIRNSWGDDWGQAGYFTMPFAYLSDRDLSDDFWTIRV